MQAQPTRREKRIRHQKVHKWVLSQWQRALALKRGDCFNDKIYSPGLLWALSVCPRSLSYRRVYLSFQKTTTAGALNALAGHKWKGVANFCPQGKWMSPLLIIGESNLSRTTMAITKTTVQRAPKNIINGKSNQHIINKAFSSLKSAASAGLSAMLMCSATSHQWEAGKLEGDSRQTIPGDKFLTHPSGSSFCRATKKTYSWEGLPHVGCIETVTGNIILNFLYTLELTCSYFRCN